MRPDPKLYEPQADCIALPPLLPVNAFEIVSGLIKAKMAIQTGNGRVEVRYGDRSVTYSKVNTATLATLTADLSKWLAIAKQLNPARYDAEGWNLYEVQFRRSAVTLI